MSRTAFRVLPALMGRDAGRTLAVVLLALALVGGVLLHRDYGVSWDEPQQRRIGQVSLNHVLETVGLREPRNDGSLDTFSDRDYGVAFELPAVVLERLLRLDDSQQIYHVRHLLTFVFFLVGVVATYLLAEKRFASRSFGVVAATLMFLHPRIFAHGFFNSKDSVFMSLWAVGLYTLIRLLDSPTTRNAIIAGCAIGLASGVRVVGLGLLLLGIASIGVSVLARETSRRAAVKHSALMSLTAGGALFLVWPYLWSAPLQNLREAVANMARFRWGGSNRYFGEFVVGSDTPWHYTPVWIGITTPIFILFLLAVGIWQTAVMAARSKRLWIDRRSRTDVVVLAALVGPILATSTLGSVLYDGWRQHQFVYPAIALLATKGLHTLVAAWRQQRHYANTVLLVAIILSSALTLLWMVRAHPLQNVYFNNLVVAEPREVFDVDYWGLANQRALEAILRSDDRPLVTVAAVSATPLEVGLYGIHPRARERLAVINPEEADYLITNYRSVPSPRRQDELLTASGSLFHRIIVGGDIILSVYDMTEEAAR